MTIHPSADDSAEQKLDDWLKKEAITNEDLSKADKTDLDGIIARSELGLRERNKLRARVAELQCEGTTTQLHDIFYESYSARTGFQVPGRLRIKNSLLVKLKANPATYVDINSFNEGQTTKGVRINEDGVLQQVRTFLHIYVIHYLYRLLCLRMLRQLPTFVRN
jgi:hypothetical protein